MSEHPIPVYILAGFLGSGKTTLLGKAIRYVKEQGRRPAVIMNELGEVNVEGSAGQPQDQDDSLGEVPTAELLGGCVCCSVRGDLALTMQQLVNEQKPDLLIIEATGAAHPMEIIDGVTEASLYMKLQLQGVITVVDALLFKEQLAKGKGPTYRLLEEQIRTGGRILLNKLDRVEAEEIPELLEAMRRWNPYARIEQTVQAEADLSIFDPDQAFGYARQEREESGRFPIAGAPSYHSSHEHITVLTHYLQAPFNSESFEAFLARLPEEIYRAKGILTFRDTTKRYLFQYAYRQPDFMCITPQAAVPDVIVLIGEHLPKERLLDELRQLEEEPYRETSDE